MTFCQCVTKWCGQNMLTDKTKTHTIKFRSWTTKNKIKQQQTAFEYDAGYNISKFFLIGFWTRFVCY